MELVMYAPIIIPTLNRIKHLKRCIESIKKNKEACNTELYISVDYPPSEKYENGYEEVKDYVKTITGFNKVNYFIQTENLGPGLNSKFLQEEIAKKYDCFIFSEDDNEFSPDFLCYMNWGLSRFRDDETIVAICSASDFKIILGNNNSDYLKLEAYNAYGSGQWISKNEKFTNYLKKKDVNEIYRSKVLRKKMILNDPMIYRWVALDSLRKIPVMRNKNGGLTSIDIWKNVYCFDKNFRCIIPVIPKSRNWGNDGSGIHSTPDQSPDYKPQTEFENNVQWPQEPRCLSAEDSNNIIHFRAKKYSITSAQKRNCTILYNINAIFGNDTVLFMYNLLKKIYRFFVRYKQDYENETNYI